MTEIRLTLELLDSSGVVEKRGARYTTDPELGDISEDLVSAVRETVENFKKRGLLND